MALTRDESKIPYSVIIAFAERNNDLRIKLVAASKLQTAEGVLNYARNLKYEDGKVDEHAQFLILATHKETIKEYPYLDDYLGTEGDEICGHSNWRAVRLGMQHDRDFSCLAIGPSVVAFLGAVSLFFTSRAAVAAKKVWGGDASFESSCGIMRDAILGGLAFYGAKACVRLVAKESNELKAVDNLQKSLRL